MIKKNIEANCFPCWEIYGKCFKTVVSPVHLQWRYCSHAQSHLSVLNLKLALLNAKPWGPKLAPLYVQHLHCNSLWPSDAIWQHWSGSTLAQVMAWCHQAPSHYLKQCWSMMRSIGIQLTSISQQVLNTPTPNMDLKITFLKLQPYLPGANELNVDNYSLTLWDIHGMLPEWVCSGSDTFLPHSSLQWHICSWLRTEQFPTGQNLFYPDSWTGIVACNTYWWINAKEM